MLQAFVMHHVVSFFSYRAVPQIIEDENARIKQCHEAIFTRKKLKALFPLFSFLPANSFFLTNMLTLLFGYRDLCSNGSDLRPYLCTTGCRKHHIEQMKFYMKVPPNSPFYDSTHEGHFHEMERDIAKLQLINALDKKILKWIIGVRDRRTMETKFCDPIAIATLDKKLQLNLEILKKGQIWRRTRFEQRLIEALDDSTVLYTDVNRIIAKFAIMD